MLPVHKQPHVSGIMKGLRFTLLLAKKLACHSSISAARRHEIPGSETKDSLLPTAIAVTSVSEFLHQSINSHTMMTATHPVGCITGEEPCA